MFKCIFGFLLLDCAWNKYADLTAETREIRARQIGLRRATSQTCAVCFAHFISLILSILILFIIVYYMFTTVSER